MYRYIGARDLIEIPATTLPLTESTFGKEPKLHHTKHYRPSQDMKWWIFNIVEEGMNAGMYERTVIANGSPSE